MFVPFCTRILLGAALIFPLAAHAVDTPLTLHDAQRRAIERSRQLVAQDAGVMANREMAVAARQLPDPVVKIGIDNLPINGADRFNLSRDFMTMRRLGVMQEFTRGEKRQLRSERFEREAQRALAEKAATSATIEQDVALAWFDRYYLDAMANIVDQQIEKARIESQTTHANYRGGRASRADGLMAKNVLIELEDRASEFRRRRLNTKVALARWIGDDSNLLLGERPDITLLRWNTQGLHQQLTHHPQITILEKQEQIASTEAQLAQANKKTDWSWEASFSQRGSAYSNMVSIGVSIPWQSNPAKRQDREIAAKLAMLEQAKAQREDALRAHVAEVSTMVNEWENGKERLARYTNERIPLTNERIEAVTTAYRGGKANLSDVLAAHRNALDVHLQALQLEWETARLWAQLNFLFPLAKGEMQ